MVDDSRRLPPETGTPVKKPPVVVGLGPRPRSRREQEENPRAPSRDVSARPGKERRDPRDLGDLPMADNTDRPQVIALPPLFFAVPMLVGIVLTFVKRLRIIPPWHRDIIIMDRWIGGVLILIGAIIAAWAMLTFRAARTNILPTRPTTTIVDAGPYRRSRNPMYVGATLAYLGASLGTNFLWPLLLLPFGLAGLHWGVIAPEERYLRAKFGKYYTDYADKVRRWI